jgi:hypothetical protein
VYSSALFSFVIFLAPWFSHTSLTTRSCKSGSHCQEVILEAGLVSLHSVSAFKRVTPNNAHPQKPPSIVPSSGVFCRGQIICGWAYFGQYPPVWCWPLSITPYNAWFPFRRHGYCIKSTQTARRKYRCTAKARRTRSYPAKRCVGPQSNEIAIHGVARHDQVFPRPYRNSRCLIGALVFVAFTL